MGHCRTVGDVRETFRRGRCVGLEWEIPEFLSLPLTPDCIFYSPDFSYRGASWYLIVYPNGHAYCASEGWVVLFLCRRLVRGPRREVLFGLGVRRADGTEEGVLSDLRLPEGCTHIRVNEFLPRSELLRRRGQLAPADSLTVTCTMYGDETPCAPGSILRCKDEPKPTRVQFQLNEQADKGAGNILSCTVEPKPAQNEQTEKEEDSNLRCKDEPKPTRVQFELKEQADTEAGEHNSYKKITINSALDDISKKKARKRDKPKSISNMPRDVKQVVKSLLNYVGLCVGMRRG